MGGSLDDHEVFIIGRFSGRLMSYRRTESDVGGEGIRDQANALVSAFRELYEIEWHCENGHKFGRGIIRTPSRCPLCKTPLVDSVMERRTSPEVRKKPFELSALEQEALARIS